MSDDAPIIDLAERRTATEAERRLDEQLRASICLCHCGKYGWQHTPAQHLICKAATVRPEGE